MTARETGPETFGEIVTTAERATLGPRGRQVIDAIRAVKAENKARRARVLAYADLAQRLTRPPLSFRKPEDWNGWVPPRTDPEYLCEWCPSVDRVNRGEHCQNPEHLARVNDSPRRATLVEICALALRREQEEPSAE